MDKNNIVVLGVVYPGLEDYLEDYFFSLDKQSYKKFDIWIFNDGLDKKILDNYISKYSELNIYLGKLEGSFTPAEIREIAIKKIKDKYDYLIFTDADDFFSLNRVKKNLNVLQYYDFCYNDMIIVNYKGERISENLYFENKNNPFVVKDFDQIMNKNFCGLSNTAINLKTVDLNFLKIPSSITAVDWWIFSLLLMKGYKGCFLKDAYTYYRQHGTNTVGGLCKINEKQLLRGVHVKKEQYKLLLEYYPSKYNSIIEKELRDILILEKKINEKGFIENYITDINNKNREFMWWENIQLEERWLTE